MTTPDQDWAFFTFNFRLDFRAPPIHRSLNGKDGAHEESLKTMSRYRKITTICCAAVIALGLAACGGGGGGLTTEQQAQIDAAAAAKAAADAAQAAADEAQAARNQAVEDAKEAIAAAEDLEAAQAAIDTAVAAGISVEQLRELEMARDERVAMLDEEAARMARTALVEAAMCEAATAECVAHHQALVDALDADPTTSADDLAEAQANLAAVETAKAEADAARMAEDDEIDRTTELGQAVGNAVDAANGLADMRSADDIANAEMLLATARGMHTEDDDYADQIAMAQMAIDRAKARNAADMAVMAAQTASGMLTDDQSKATVEAARAAVNAAKQAVMDNADALTDADESGFNAQIALAEAPVGPLESKIADDEEAEQQRLAMEEEEEQRKANEAMAATAAKLHAGIAAQNGDVANTTAAGTALAAADEQGAAYNNVDVPANGTAVDTRIMVGIGTATPVALTEDKKTTVAALHGWAGKKYAASGTGVDGTYEAVVYSNVGEPTMGKKFGSDAAVTDSGDYQYQLDAADRNGAANKALTIVPATHAALISLPSVTKTAGTETFKAPSGQNLVTVSGMFHGVSGTFSCLPTTVAEGCTAAVAARGFTLDGGTWLFIPSNAEARVTETPDATYASYGWWIHTAANGDLTASAFVDDKGTVAAATGITALQGTATYMGGAAGKYALSSSTGGTNDAGHFTARATLEADFGDDMITGTIDQFMGADGMSRNWSVELMEQTITDGGLINGTDGAGAGGASMTKWTIDGTAGAAAGQWTGALKDNGTDDVPKVGTGTFYSTYGQDGKMVGAFGVNKQQ